MSARLGLYGLILTLSLAAVQAEDVPSLVQKTKPAVVEILTFDQQNKPLKTGTGFFISSDGALLTNFHVISGASSILAKTPTGAVYFLKNVVAASESDDVAQLQFLATDVSYLTLGSSLKTVEGQRVLVIGNPEGLEGTVSDGIISAFRAGRSMIQITAPISPGSSGSPVLDETGQVIGMATLVSKEGQNINFAISSEAIKDAIQSGAASSVAVATPNATESPSTGSNDADLWATLNFSIGVSEDDAKRYKVAIVDYTEAIRAKPDFADAYANRGWSYLQLGLYEKAIMDLSEAIRLKPDNPQTYLSRGNAYRGLKQQENAIRDYSAVIRLKPDCVEAYNNMGNAFRDLRQYERAIADYTEAIRLKPDLGAAYYNRGNTYKDLLNPRAAYADLKKAKKLGFHSN
jgi:predicted O-linked N-acetylglucosamine transferase (SPINDLY family)